MNTQQLRDEVARLRRQESPYTSRIHVLCLVLCCCVLTACQSSPRFECPDALGCVTLTPGEPFKIGVIQALSGSVAPIGTEQLRAIQLALDARDHQFLGHPIELLIEDGQCSAEGGIVAAMKLVVEHQLVAILGTTCSSSAVAMIGIMSEAGLIMISGTNTAISLTSVANEAGVDWRPGYFRTSSNDAVAAQTAANFVFKHLGLKKVAIINDGDAYTRSYTGAFKQTFTGIGGEIVLDATIDKGDTNMHPVLNAAAQFGAELVFFPVFSPEADFIVLQAHELAALQHSVLMGGGALLTEGFINSIGADGVGMYIVSAQPAHNPAIDALMTVYEAAYHESAQTNSLETAYDAVNLLLHALEKVVVQEQNGNVHIGRQALRDALYATVNFEGVTGRLTCDQFGDCSAVEFVVLLLDDPAASVEDVRANIVYRSTHEETPDESMEK